MSKKSMFDGPWTGEQIWTTMDGDEIPMKDMTDSHLKNALRHSIKHNATVAIKACQLEIKRRNFETIKEFLELKDEV